MIRPRLLGLGLVIAGLALAFWGVAAGLIADWSRDESYSHSFLLVPLALYVVWRQRAQLASIPARPSAAGLVAVIVSLLTLGVGRLGAEVFLTRIALVGALAGTVIFLWGFRHLKALTFAFVLLLLAIPIPAIVFDQVAFPLQLLAARFGEAVISACQIPVLREGNELVLASTTLEVAEACSGIWSLVSLVSLAAIWGYVTESPLWLRWLLVAASVPIAMLTNGIRVAGTGIAVHLFGPGAAEGLVHTVFGWLVFIGAWMLLLAVHSVALWIRPSAPPAVDTTQAGTDAPAGGSAVREAPTRAFLVRAVIVAFCLVAAAAGLHLLTRAEAVPLRESFAGFPLAVGEWTGRDTARVPRDALDARRVDDHLSRDYVGPSQRSAGLYIGYYATQRQGQTVHSPLNGIPGAGWEPTGRTRTTLQVPGAGGAAAREIEVNRVVVRKGPDQMVVYYWYQAHGRVIASDYRGKIHSVVDAIRLDRSDSAIVRITVPVDPRATGGEEEADRAAQDFARAIFPVLGRYLPA